jgi:hypothetical protein
MIATSLRVVANLDIDSFPKRSYAAISETGKSVSVVVYLDAGAA